MLAAERTGRQRDLGIRVLDVVRLVEHHGGELARAVLLQIAPQEGVAGDDQITRVDLGEKRGTVGTVDGQGAQFGGELGSLLPPVRHE